MHRSALTLVLASFVVACVSHSSGGGGSGGGGSGGGSLTIKGAPHDGTYARCEVGADVGGKTVVNCYDLPGCTGTNGCVLTVKLPDAAGTYTCTAGTASVEIDDPGIPADPRYRTTNAFAVCEGQLSHACPSDAHGCNQLLGSCTVKVTTIANALKDPGSARGHFKGTVTAKVYSAQLHPTCKGGASVKGAGKSYDIQATGSW